MRTGLIAAAGFRVRRLGFPGLVLALALIQSAGVRGAEVMAEPAPLAARFLLLEVARAGDLCVAVGDHGNILRSADQGRTWSQSSVPTQALLTSVSFPDPQHGWAVGHDGVILASTDAGATWHRQDHGDTLDAIYLSVRFRDNRHGLIAGAYGKFLTTADGGVIWTPGKPCEDEAHFNRLGSGPEGTLYLIGESGLLLTSADQGGHWTKVEVPYPGSLFGFISVDSRTFVLSGLRGHIFLTTDGGANWQPQEVAPQVLLMGGTRLRDGTLIFAGQGGNFFISRDAGRSFNHWKPADFGTSVADLIPAEDGWILTVGEGGAVRLQLP